ncbi:discoidin domain-containing protein [Brenneria populi]|uniref:Discoidin domain-containing protein n=1 Tax=Brenneria populi TaxID=1505588 RepID=A0ABU6JSY0_9GAMM|nr:discoidin domain-containing protein [Brenneria populi Li et al. 2015]
MANLTETAEFTADVPRLDVDTPVKGWDGAELGPANEQAQALANRTAWLRQRIQGQVTSVNGKTGSVTLTAGDVSADNEGTADGLMTAHLNDADPHTQYFDELRGDARYVQASLANAGNGWLQLDASGKIPAAMLQTLTSRYVVVADEVARLALASSSNLTICAQADIDTLFYLNGGDNPAVAANWVQGQAATVSGVSSVYGRTGAVTAQSGDYDADQINETTNRKFVSAAEKTAWNAKQAALVSGSNIRSLFGNSLLGSGNLAPTPAQMGAAAAVHAHTTADITDFTQQAQALITASLEAGSGVTLGQNPVSGKTIISASGGSGGGGGYIVVDRDGATANQNHVFNFSAQSDYSYYAYALKEEAGAQNQTYLIDDFSASNISNYNITSAVIFDGAAKSYIGETYALSSDGVFYSQEIKADGESISINMIDESLVPAMASNSQDGFTVSASSQYSTNYMPYFAFDRKDTAGDTRDAWVSAANTNPTESSPQWLRVDLSYSVILSGYSLTNRSYSNAVLSPNSWQLQGSNDGSVWETLHQVSADTNNSAGAIREFGIETEKSFSKYRLLITAKNGSSYNYVALKELSLFPAGRSLLINSAGGDFYTVNNGQLSLVPTPSDENGFDTGFTSSGEIVSDVLAGLLPISIYSPASLNINTVYTPHPQIVIPQSLSALASYSEVNSVTLTATQTGAGVVRAAVSRDLSDWITWDGSAWVSIGALSANTASAEKLIAQGMTPAALNAITTEQWALLFGDNGGVPDDLAFALALDITDPAADAVTIDNLALNVNEASSWKLQTPAEVEIRWRPNSVTFKTVTAGNYKLAYQIP